MDNNHSTQDVKLNLLQAVNGNGSNDNIDVNAEHFKSILEKEYDLKEALFKLGEADQEKILIKTVILDSRLDFVASTKKLQKVFNEEFENMIKKLNEKYNSEVLAVKQLFRKELVGQGLVNMVNATSKAGWVLIMKENSVHLYKCYNPEFEVIEGYYEDGTIRMYDNAVTLLRGIYVNILHPKITTGTIYLSLDGEKHPNCEERNFGAACPGSLEDREIPVTDTGALITLLDEISRTYERMHLDSAYYVPAGSYTEEKGVPQWTAT